MSTGQSRTIDIRTLDQFYTPVEERFECITHLAHNLLGITVAAVSIVTPRRQWFKSVVGWNVTELPIELSLCRTTVSEGDIVVVPDALKDRRFAKHPLVTRSNGFRFYAGYPLKDRRGAAAGTFCVMGFRPRQFGLREMQYLQDLGAAAEEEIRTSKLCEVHEQLVRKLGVARRQAMLDPLTRVWNHQGGTVLLQEALKAASENSYSVAACVIDIDNFSQINNRYGVSGGDEVLRKVAGRIVALLRPQDVVVRLEGDAFLFIVTNVSHVQFGQISERVRQRIFSTPIQTRAGPIGVSVSLGGSVYVPGMRIGVEEMLCIAREAQCLATKQGGNFFQMAFESKPLHK